MAAVQLYLPEESYDGLKKLAKLNDKNFAGYTRIYLSKKTISKNDLEEKFPMLKFVGMFRGSPNSSNNEEIDKFLYG